MSQQQQQPPQSQQYGQGIGQQSQQQFGQQSQGGGFEQFVPPQVADAIYSLEEIETDAEWSLAQAIRQGDGFTASELDDLIDLAHIQKRLLLRQSSHAQSVGQCVQEGFQQATRKLQGSQVPGVQQVSQKAQQLAQQIPQASMQVAQSGSSRGMGGQPQGGTQQQSFGQQSVPQY